MQKALGGMNVWEGHIRVYDQVRWLAVGGAYDCNVDNNNNVVLFC